MPLPAPTLPTYNLTLPVSGQKIKYRPFVMREEKIMLLAREGNNIEEISTAIAQVLELCTFGKVNIAKLPIADTEFLFIKVREQSIGSQIEATINCSSCNHEQPYIIDLSKTKITSEPKSEHIKVDTTTIVTMRHPTINTVRYLKDATEQNAALAVTAGMIESITMKDKVFAAEDLTHAELMDWLDNLTEGQVAMIGEWIDSLPKIIYEDVAKCKSCGSDINIRTEGIDNFFD
jgi:hypothetical protein